MWKVARRLDGWKRAFLSKGGRLVLIQSVLASLSVYYMSIFRMLKGISDSIEKMMRDFFWENGEAYNSRHLVDWKTMCKMKEEGGAGLGRIQERNTALLAKWLWRFPLERNALWHKVIKSKFGF